MAQRMGTIGTADEIASRREPGLLSSGGGDETMTGLRSAWRVVVFSPLRLLVESLAAELRRAGFAAVSEAGQSVDEAIEASGGQRELLLVYDASISARLDDLSAVVAAQRVGHLVVRAGRLCTGSVAVRGPWTAGALIAGRLARATPGGRGCGESGRGLHVAAAPRRVGSRRRGDDDRWPRRHAHTPRA